MSIDYHEEWEITLSTREKFLVDGGQMKKILESLGSGDRGYIHLGDKGFQLAHIVSYYRTRREIKNQLASGKKNSELTKEEWLKARLKVDEIRRKMKGSPKVIRSEH